MYTLLSLLCISFVDAFSKEGHEAVGMTAMSGLDSLATSKLKNLLQGKDAADVANWAHTVERELDGMQPLHFQGQSSDAVCKADMCPNGRCLTSAIKYLYVMLTEGDVAQYQTVLNKQLTDSDGLRFLMNLIADMHQPMSLGRSSDDFGKQTKIKSSLIEANLYDMWNDGITQASITHAKEMWWSGWTNVGNLRESWTEEKLAWKQKGINIIDDWVEENAQISCEIYTQLNQLKTQQESKETIELPDEVLGAWVQLLRRRILIAGARTAILVNAVLLTRPSNSFRSGSNFKTSEMDVEPLDSLDALNKPSKAKGLLINLAVLICVGFIVLAFHKFRLSDSIEEKIAATVELTVKKKNTD